MKIDHSPTGKGPPYDDNKREFSQKSRTIKKKTESKKHTQVRTFRVSFSKLWSFIMQRYP